MKTAVADKPQCPHYRPPRHITDPETDKVYASSAMCDLVDKFCLLESDDRCETYEEYLKEEQDEGV